MRSLLPLLLLLLLPALPAAAHDLTVTDVLIVVAADGRVVVDVKADLDALVLGAAASADSAQLAAALAALPAEELAARLERLEGLFERRLRLRADGRPIPLRVRFPQYGGPRPPAVEPSLLGLVARLEGQLPVGATRITFQASRAFPPVHLTILDQAAAGGRRELLEQGAESTPYRLGEAAQELDRSTVAGRYLVLGFLHILPAGLDHVLFVLGLFLLSARFAPLLWQISAFTVAHTLTLALSSYGLLSLPPRVVEPMIALSIAWVAVENVVSRELRPWRPLVVFAFGLLHGLGFAGVLAELGLPRQELATALLAFNAGVELGQLAVVALAFLAVGWARHRPWYRRRLTLPASALIAAAGLALFADRIAG